MNEESGLTELLASVPFTIEKGVRFHERVGTAEHNGEKIELCFDFGGGVNVTYKGGRYRLSPDDIIGAVVDAVDGTTNGS